MADPFRLLTVREVAEIAGIGVPTVWKWVAARTFPEPIKLSSHATRWRSDEVMAWIDSRPRMRSAA